MDFPQTKQINASLNQIKYQNTLQKPIIDPNPHKTPIHQPLTNPTLTTFSNYTLPRQSMEVVFNEPSQK
jgi:hypothetical protein